MKKNLGLPFQKEKRKSGEKTLIRLKRIAKFWFANREDDELWDPLWPYAVATIAVFVGIYGYQTSCGIVMAFGIICLVLFYFLCWKQHYWENIMLTWKTISQYRKYAPSIGILVAILNLFVPLYLLYNAPNDLTISIASALIALSVAGLTFLVPMHIAHKTEDLQEKLHTKKKNDEMMFTGLDVCIKFETSLENYFRLLKIRPLKRGPADFQTIDSEILTAHGDFLYLHKKVKIYLPNASDEIKNMAHIIEKGITLSKTDFEHKEFNEFQEDLRKLEEKYNTVLEVYQKHYLKQYKSYFPQ